MYGQDDLMALALLVCFIGFFILAGIVEWFLIHRDRKD